jgi:hypothetical protein
MSHSSSRLGRLLTHPVVLALLTVGCGAAGTRGAASPAASKPSFVFPSRDELAALPATAPAAKAFGADDVSVDAWTYQTPAAQEADAYTDASPWGRMVDDVVAQQQAAGDKRATIALSPALRCASEELGRFYLEHHAFPSESLRRFTVARCGATTPDALPVLWTIEAPAGASEEAIFARGEADMRKALSARLAADGGKARLVGLARVRDGKRLVVTALTARVDARLNPLPHRADAAHHVRIEGTLLTDAERVNGFANVGADAVSECEVDRAVRLPRFALRCRIGAGDPAAWVEVVAEKKGRILAEPVADVLAYDGEEPADAYHARALGAPAVIEAPAGFAPALLERLNRVRTGAKLPPVTLAARQSAQNARLTGTLLDARTGGDHAVADKIAIGLVAGWEVDGLIRRGDFFLGCVPQTRDVTAWLGAALEHPVGRRVLLDPRARQMAIGAAMPEGATALGAAVTTYELFDSPDHSPEAARIAQRIAALRADRQLPAPVLVRSEGELAPEARLVLDRGKAPMTALEDAMQAVSSSTGNAVAGWVVEGTNLDALEIPEALLQPGALQIAIEVTHHRAPGAAWGQLVVLIVAVGATGHPTAGTDI